MPDKVVSLNGRRTYPKIVDYQGTLIRIGSPHDAPEYRDDDGIWQPIDLSGSVPLRWSGQVLQAYWCDQRA